MDKRTRFSETLKRFAPEIYVPYLVDLILKSKVVFKIVPGRKSKLGDFRAKIVVISCYFTNIYNFIFVK